MQTEVFDDANEDAPTVSHEDSELRVLGKNRYVRAPMFNSYVPLVHFDIYGYVRRLVGQKSKRPSARSRIFGAMAGKMSRPRID